jgi:DNA-binding MarR family transcriptional regulator
MSTIPHYDVPMAGTVRWLTRAEERAWRGWLRLGWLLDAAIGSDLAADSGLSHSDYYVLVQLSEAPERRMRMRELAAGIAWSKSRVSHQVARMESRGLVRRTECEADGRGTYAELLPAGLRAIEAAAPGHVASIRRNLLDHLSREQVAHLAAIAESVVPHLKGGSGDRSGTID